jgi:hypothetical protein
MDEERIIAEVAKRNGVLLHRDDPILQIHTMLDLHTADHQEREAKSAERDEALRADMRTTTAAIATATAAIESAARRPLLTSSQIKHDLLPALLTAFGGISLALGALLLVLAFTAGMVVQGWKAPTLTCQVERGGLICWTWKVQPTEPAETAAPAPQTAAPAQTKPMPRKPS